MATSREDARPLQRCGWRANGRLRYPATYTTSGDATPEHPVLLDDDPRAGEAGNRSRTRAGGMSLGWKPRFDFRLDGEACI